MDKSCGKVSEEDRDEIKRLFQRKSALSELFLVLTKADGAKLIDMYDKILADMGEATFQFHSWWEKMAKRYKWEAVEGANWRIDFDTCEVFLVQP